MQTANKAENLSPDFQPQYLPIGML